MTFLMLAKLQLPMCSFSVSQDKVEYVGNADATVERSDFESRHKFLVILAKGFSFSSRKQIRRRILL